MNEEPGLNDLIKQAGLWVTYESGLRLKNRFVPRDAQYIDDLCRACLDDRTVTLPPSTVVYRARINPPEREGAALPMSEMREPPPEKATDGRINPAGLPCFYAALDPQTALAEVRPWRAAALTIASFTTTRPIVVVDLRLEGQRSAALWQVAHMIQRPVHEEDPLRYLGTQYLAERLKAAQAGGLLYDSALGPYDKARDTKGTNVALFSSEALKDGKGELWRVRDVKYDADPRPE